MIFLIIKVNLVIKKWQISELHRILADTYVQMSSICSCAKYIFSYKQTDQDITFAYTKIQHYLSRLCHESLPKGGRFVLSAFVVKGIYKLGLSYGCSGKGKILFLSFAVNLHVSVR